MSATRNGDPRLQTAHIFNSAVAAWAISAAWELGALDELRDSQRLDIVEFARREQLDTIATIGMFRALAAVGIVTRDGTVATPSTNFTEVYRTRSFFHWLARGSAELFRQMPTVMRKANRHGSFYQRDPEAIAYACREINRVCYDARFWEAVEGLDFDITLAADLGCGSGERIIELALHHPRARGLGIDIAHSCVAEATQAASRAGVADRVRFVADNVLAMAEHPHFAEVDLLTCFMMGHDLWPRERCIWVLGQLRTRFPKVRRLLLGDATRTSGVADQDLPVFTLGFEVGHDLMGTFIPTVADWESTFEQGGWRLVRKHTIDMAVGEVIFELEHR